MIWRLNSASAVPQADRFHDAHLTDAGICAKGALAKYWVDEWIYFKELELVNCVNPFFFFWLIDWLIDLVKYSNILRYWIFDFHELYIIKIKK